MVAGVMLCQLVVSVLAAAMAWSLVRFASLMDWPRRGVWAAAMLCSLTLPIIFLMDSWQQPAFTSATRTPSAMPSGGAPTLAPRVAEPEASSPRAPPRALPDRTIEAPSATTLALKLRLPVIPQWDRVLSTLWIASSVIALCLLSASLLHVRRLIRRLPQTYAHGVRVLVSIDLGPAVFGWLRPVIVMPGAVLTSEHRKLVLMHEQSHARARDPLLFGAFLVAVALTPWNPVLWWQLRQLRFAIEVDCDRRVLRAGIDVASYGQMLLQVAQLEHRLPLGAMALTEPVSQLGRRVTIMTTELSMPARVRLAVIAFCVLGVSAAIAAQLEPPEPVRQTPAAVVGAQNVFGFRSAPSQSGMSSPAEMAARAAELQAALDDPGRRAALREERRPQIRSDYPDLAEFLGIDPETSQQLIDLIVDQSLESDLRQLRVPLRRVRVPSQGNSVLMEPVNLEEVFKAAAEDLDRHRAALQRFLGEARFGLYLDYVARLPVRQELARFSERLGQEQLSSYQRERMVELLMVERGIHLSNVATPPQDMAAYLRGPRLGQPGDWISNAERSVQRSLARRDRLVRNAASVLTANQLAALERMENERSDAERDNLDRLRTSSSLYATAKGGAATQEPARAAVERRILTGRLRWSVTLAVGEAEPKVTSFLSSFGERVSFAAAEGLWVEATPTAYDSKRFTVDLKFYETDARGVRHLIDDRADAADFGAAALTQGELAKRRVVMAGRKSYRVASSVAGALE